MLGIGRPAAGCALLTAPGRNFSITAAPAPGDGVSIRIGAGPRSPMSPKRSASCRWAAPTAHRCGPTLASIGDEGRGPIRRSYRDSGTGAGIRRGLWTSGGYFGDWRVGCCVSMTDAAQPVTFSAWATV